MRRPGPPKEIPPPLELACLKALWGLGEGNVKNVRDTLASSRNLAYTTVMTVLDRLARKGAVSRRKAGRSFVYAPVLSRDALRRLAVKELVNSFFDGSDEQFATFLTGGPPEASAPEPETPAVENRLDTTLL